MHVCQAKAEAVAKNRNKDVGFTKEETALSKTKRAMEETRSDLAPADNASVTRIMSYINDPCEQDRHCPSITSPNVTLSSAIDVWN